MRNAKKKKAKKKAGKPKTQFTQEQIATIEMCAFHGCQTETIATLADIPASTLRDNFRGLLTKKRAERKLELRKAQDKKANQGDTGMLCFLGKNELRQTDKQMRIHDVTDGLAELMKEISGNGSGLPIKQE